MSAVVIFTDSSLKYSWIQAQSRSLPKWVHFFTGDARRGRIVSSVWRNSNNLYSKRHMWYTVLIFQSGCQSAQSTYTLPNNELTTSFSVHKRKADTLVNQTKRSILGVAFYLAERISAMDQVKWQAEQRRLCRVQLARRLLLQITQSQNPTDCRSAKFTVTSLPKCGHLMCYILW